MANVTTEGLSDHLHTAVLLLDADDRVVKLNHAAETLFLVSARQATNQRPKEFAPEAALLHILIGESRRTGRAYTERERRMSIGAGRDVVVDATVTPLADGNVLLELAEVDRHARITREQQLLTQSRAIRELIRGLAHEIKNPLGGLRGAAQLLQEELARDELHEYTRVIIAEADRLRQLVDSLLGPSGAPAREQINLHEVLERVRALVEAESGGAPVGRDYDPSIPPVTAERDHLVQAVLNLARNARQAAGPKGAVALRTRTQRQFTIADRLHRLVARIDVIDDGPGIPPDRQEDIFYPMVTTRPEGSGLGLPIAQNLVGRCGGLIECNSEPGRTVFTVWLPVEVING